MPQDEQKAILRQIDDVLAKCEHVAGAVELSRALNTVLSTVHRLAPPGSTYANAVQDFQPVLASGSVIELSRALDPALGMLHALRSDYEAGYLLSVVELVHADIFADFLDMAQYLSQQGYKDAAAVISGSVLEAHLRKLCDKHGIPTIKEDGTPKKADSLNSDLSGVNVYSKLDQKNVTAWLDLRNKAAHGHYAEYSAEQVTLMHQSVRDFASRYRA